MIALSRDPSVPRLDAGTRQRSAPARFDRRTRPRARNAGPDAAWPAPAYGRWARRCREDPVGAGACAPPGASPAGRGVARRFDGGRRSAGRSGWRSHALSICGGEHPRLRRTRCGGICRSATCSSCSTTASTSPSSARDWSRLCSAHVRASRSWRRAVSSSESTVRWCGSSRPSSPTMRGACSFSGRGRGSRSSCLPRLSEAAIAGRCVRASITSHWGSSSPQRVSASCRRRRSSRAWRQTSPRSERCVASRRRTSRRSGRRWTGATACSTRSSRRPSEACRCSSAGSTPLLRGRSPRACRSSCSLDSSTSR